MRRVWFHAGGLIAQGCLAAVLLFLPAHWLVDRVAQFNLLVAATNALPWKLGSQWSDGFYLLDAFTGHRRSRSIVVQRAALSRMARRESAVGSAVGRVYSDVCLAWADIVVGRPGDAAPLFKLDPPEVSLDSWVEALYQYVLAEWHRSEQRPLAALRASKCTLAAGLDSRPLEEAAGLAALAEARALIDLDSPQRAERALARIAGLGGPIGLQASSVLLWATLGASTEDLELATWRVERRMHDAWWDPLDPALALWAAADRLDELGRVNAARGARSAARTLVQSLLRSLPLTDHPSVLSRLGEAAFGLASPAPRMAGEH
jgi:hypothetical protein